MHPLLIPPRLALIPPRLALRALDDLHAIAEAARTLPAVETRLTERIDALETRAAEAIAAVDAITARADDALAVGRDVAATGAEVARALPELERALQSIEGINASARTVAGGVEPLLSAAGRVGRIVDRMPQGFFGRRPPA